VRAPSHFNAGRRGSLSSTNPPTGSASSSTIEDIIRKARDTWLEFSNLLMFTLIQIGFFAAADHSPISGVPSVGRSPSYELLDEIRVFRAFNDQPGFS